MSVWFLANVGSRDVQVEERSDLPRESRVLGDLILSDWEGFKGQLKLPILMHALEWVLRQEGQESLEGVVLFASDQRDERYRPSDTLPFAQIIARVIAEGYPALAQRVRIVPIQDNPSDYDAMHRFYAAALREFEQAHKAYLEVTGGTPSMSFMLLWHGIDVLGERAYPLYVARDQARPRNLTIGRDLKARELIADVRLALRGYQYRAVQNMIEQGQALLSEMLPQHFRGLQSLVRFALARYNFSFDVAERALSQIERELQGEAQREALALAEDISRRDERWLLREEIYAAELDFLNQAYKDALANVFAFREGALRLLAIQRGVVLQEGRKLDANWLASQPELAEHLRSKDIDVKRNVTTFVFERILDFWGRSDDSLKKLSAAIKPFEELSKLRNSATHNHDGVSEADIAQAYPGGVEAVLAGMREIYQNLSGVLPPPNPYDILNALIDRLLAGGA